VGELVDGFLESPVDHAALGSAHGFAEGGACATTIKSAP
jgi:hypothetical protein